MNSLTWRHLAKARIWSAYSVDGGAWEIRCKEDGLFYLVDNNRLPYNATPFDTLRGAKAWCEEREVELIAEQPKRRLAKLYRRIEDGQYWVYGSEAYIPSSSPIWKCVGSAWITEGEFADD